jgi:hypothetical protein
MLTPATALLKERKWAEGVVDTRDDGDLREYTFGVTPSDRFGYLTLFLLRRDALRSQALLASVRIRERYMRNWRYGPLAALAVAASTSLTNSTIASAEVILTYTGDDFTSCSTGPCPSTGHVTATIDLSSPLMDSFETDINGIHGTNVGTSVLSFVFSDGLGDTINQNNSTGSFTFTTDSLGNIVNWQVAALFFANGFQIESNNFPSIGVDDITNNLLGFQDFNANDPGSWVTSAGSIPEASTWAMLGVGFAGLGLVGFSRRKSAPYTF